MGCSDTWAIDPDGAVTTWDDETTVWDGSPTITVWDYLDDLWEVICDE